MGVKTIYIILSRPYTMLSSLIYKVTKAPYTHVALSLDRKITRVYSIARIYAHNPFCARLAKEDIYNKKGVYGRNNGTTPCVIYALRVPEETYTKIEEELEIMLKERKRYHYNKRGLIANYLGKDYQRDYHYFCSEFVADLLIKAGVLPSEKKACSYRPIDFTQIPQTQMVYSGNIKELRNLLDVKKDD